MKYQYSFGPKTTYGHVLQLLEQHARPDGVLVDLGCGHAPLAEPARDAGFQYVGADLEQGHLDDLEARGIEAHALDLRDDEALRAFLTQVQSDHGEISGVLLLDVIEHVVDPERLLRSVREATAGDRPPSLYVSVPNITHRDVAGALLRGEWRYQEAGLLDKTHVTFFSAAHLDATMRAAGWSEVGRNDTMNDRTEVSRLHSLFDGDSNVARYLDQLTKTANPSGHRTYQFVRALVPFTPEASQLGAAADDAAPGLSVLVRTRGDRNELLGEALLTLAAQDTEDFEVLLLVHSKDSAAVATVRQYVSEYPPSFNRRVRVLQVVGGDRARPLNVGIDEARGRYVAFLDDDDVVTADWVSNFLQFESSHSGRVVRAVVADQQANRPASGSAPYDLQSAPEVNPRRVEYDHVRHFATNRTPICGFAVPRRAIEELELRFDERRQVLEDWEFLLRAAAACGVVDTGRVTSIYRRWARGESTLNTIDREVWRTTKRAILLELGDEPMLFPEGTPAKLAELHRDIDLLRSRRAEAEQRQQQAVSTLEQLRREVREARERTAAAERRVEQLEGSGSWRITRPYRAVADLLRGRR